MTMTTMTTTKPNRPVGTWTKQIASFATSFAFFGLAGFLQVQAANEAAQAQALEEAAAQAEAAALVAAQEATQVVQVNQPELLGPVQPLTEEDIQAAQVAAAEPVAPAPVVASPAPVQAEPVPVDTHTAGS
jgi:hypothetical protein